MPSPRPSSLEEVLQLTLPLGINLVGLVSSAEFDRCQPRGRRAGELLPGCGTILVVGSGGRELWNRTGALANAGPASAGRHPLEHHAAEVQQLLLGWLTERDHACRAVQPGDRAALNFAHIGEMAGLGTVSPVVGKLIHPEYGLWVDIVCAVLVVGEPFGASWQRSVQPSFQPCLTCARPCVAACPAEVHDGRGKSDLSRCAQHRHIGGCTHGCDVRRVCPIGAEHRHSPEEESLRQAWGLATLRRQHGLGVWRFVPRSLRG